jgi:N-acetylmuramoyl-L-alanine amidase
LTKLRRRDLSFLRIVALTFIPGVGLLLWPSRPVRSDNFVFYFPNARHVLPFELIEQKKYLPLLQVLNVIGKVTGLQEKKPVLRVWFGETQLEFRLDNKKVRLGKNQVELADPVRVSNGQWVVPVDFLTTGLPRLAHQTIEYQVGSNRIFIGDVKPSAFSVRLDRVANGTRLTVQFTDKVTVRTESQNGKWVMSLGDRAVEPMEPSYEFHDPYVKDLRFDDQDGIAKLILTPVENGLDFYPSMADSGKVLLADVMKPPPTVVEQPRTPTEVTAPSSATAPISPAGAEEVQATPPGPPLPVVVLDAGHGGEDAGARSHDGVVEKDLVAQVVARVRLALLETRKYRVVLTRVGDSNPSFEQREVAANVARPAAFITFHAGNLGSSAPRIMIYSYHSSSAASGAGDGSHQPFIPWTRIQETHLDRSRQLAETLGLQFEKIPGVTTAKPEEAPVRSLRSVDSPAVAIEFGSVSPETDSAVLTGLGFQQQVSEAIARALANFEGKQT